MRNAIRATAVGLLVWFAAGIAVTAGGIARIGVLLGSGLLLVAAVAAWSSSVMSDRVDRDRAAFGAALVWCGLLAPAVISQVRSRSDLDESLLSGTAVLRGLVPAVVVALVVILWPHRRSARYGWTEAFLALYLTVNVVSSLWSPVPMATLLKGLHLVVAYSLLLILLNRWRDDGRVLQALSAMAHVIVISSLVGLLVVPSQALTEGTVPRLRGVLPYAFPTTLGMLAAFGLLCILGGIGIGRRRHSSTVLAVVFALDAVVLGLTRARTAGAVFVVGAVLIAATSSGRSRQVAAIAVSVLVFAGGIAWITSSQDVIGVLRRGQDDRGIATLTGRTISWGVALEIWSQDPLVGTGYYAGHRFGEYADLRNEELQTNLDNIWVETLLDTGIVGVSALSGFVISGGVRAWSRRREMFGHTRWVLVVGFVLSSLFSPSLQSPGYLQIVFGCLLLLPGASAKRPTNCARTHEGVLV